jgi:hypothetical protein
MLFKSKAISFTIWNKSHWMGGNVEFSRRNADGATSVFKVRRIGTSTDVTY